MGKIMVVGKATQGYTADQCHIIFEIKATGDTPAKASVLSSEECERFLSKLQSMGIEPNTVEIFSDQIDRDYHAKSVSFESKKNLKIDTPADMQIVNAIRDVIESGFKTVTFRVQYLLSNEGELKKQLLKEAIGDSRKKAELLAESMGLSITGVDTANLSGDEDVYDLAQITEKSRFVGAAPSTMRRRALSDQLKPEKVELEAEVKIVWLVG